MIDAIATLYETDLLESPPLPPRSRLYHLPPLGRGTALTESLTSYVIRLAAAHRVSVRKLVVHEILPLAEGVISSSNMASMLTTRAYLVNGFDRQARGWSATLEHLTQHATLRPLTMLTWRNVLATRQLLRPQLAWCPACYEHWRQSGQTLYDPLLWMMQAVSLCPWHHQPLQTCCPYADCQKVVYPLTPHRRIGYCPHCDRWLGTLAEPVQGLADEADLSWPLWTAQAVGRLIAVTPTVVEPPSRRQLAEAFGFCVNHLSGGSARALAGRLDLPTERLNGWLCGEQVPQLGLFLDFCYRLDLSPLHFLTEPIDAVDNEVMTPQHLQMIHDQLTKDDQHRRRRQQLRSTLQAILDSTETPPLTLHLVARRLGCTPGSLHHHCPDLAQALLERAQTYASRRQTAWQQALEAALVEIPPPAVAEMSLRLGCYDNYLYDHFPELCQALSQPHKTYHWARQMAVVASLAPASREEEARIARVRAALETLVAEAHNPPPTLAAVAQRLGCSKKFLRTHCPGQCQRLWQGTQDHFQTKRQTLRQAMRALLDRPDDPPPTLLAVARQLGCSTHLLTYYMPDLVTELMGRRRAARSSELEALRQALATSLASDTVPPPSLAQMARTLDVAKRSLQKHFPHLCQAILDRFQRYRHHHKLTGWVTVRQAVETVLDETEMPPPSVRTIAQRLNYPAWLLHKACPEQCRRIAARHQAYLADRKQAWQQVLQTVLDREEQPVPSLKEVADRLGTHRNQVHSLFPELARAISARYLADQRRQGQERVRQRCEEVRQVTRDLHRQGIYPSLSQVAARLSLPNFMVRKEAQAARLEVLREVGLR